MSVFGRALILIAGLALAVGLGGAQAQELAPEVRESALCGGVVATMGAIRHAQTDDEIHIFHGLLLAESAASAIYKDLNGEMPAAEILAAIESLMDESAKKFSAQNEHAHSVEERDELYRKALGCYVDLLGFMSERGFEILSGTDTINVYTRTLRIYIQYVAKYNEK